MASFDVRVSLTPGAPSFPPNHQPAISAAKKKEGLYASISISSHCKGVRMQTFLSKDEIFRWKFGTNKMPKQNLRKDACIHCDLFGMEGGFPSRLKRMFLCSPFLFFIWKIFHPYFSFLPTNHTTSEVEIKLSCDLLHSSPLEGLEK